MNHKCTPLRSLALKAAYGEMSTGAYQQARRKLLNAITEGELAPEELTHSGVNFKVNKGADAAKLVTTLAVLAAVAGAIYLATGQGQQADRPANNNPQPTANHTLVLRSPLEQSMAHLLDNSRWSSEDIGHFLAIWRSLDNDERARQRTTITFKKLRDRTRMKVNEMEALSGAEQRAVDSELLLQLRRLDNALH